MTKYKVLTRINFLKQIYNYGDEVETEENIAAPLVGAGQLEKVEEINSQTPSKKMAKYKVLVETEIGGEMKAVDSEVELDEETASILVGEGKLELVPESAA